MKDRINKPAIRFKGFDEAWEQRKLGDIGNTFTGLSGKTKEDFGKGDAEFITYLNVFNNPISNIKLTERVEIDKKQNEVRYGDIFFTTSSETPEEVGMSSVWLGNRDNVYLNSFCFGYRVKEKVDPFYMAYSLRSNSIRIQFILLAQGISRYNISKTKAMNIKISLPKLEEQVRIGEFFKSIDNLITLHQRKLDKLKKIKKSMLEKMFPKNGEKRPEVRFEGFNDDWEQRKLGDIAGRYDNLRVPVTASNRIPGVTPYYGANGIQDYVDGFTHNGEFVLVAEDGANDLKNYPVHYVNGKVWVNNHAHVIQALEDISDNKFLKYSFKILNMEPYLVGGSRAKLNANIMMDLVINTPIIKEQIKIGGVFSSLDNLITLHQRKLEKLEKIKKAMLEKMFV